MPKRNNFIEGLRRKQQRAEAAQTAQPAKKAPSEMTDEELEREIARTQIEKRVLAERAVEAGRQEATGRILLERAPALWPTKKKRPSWK